MAAVTQEVSSLTLGFFFFSAPETGTGANQNIAHGMGRVPIHVLVLVDPTDAMSGAMTVVEGTHDTTNVIVNVTSGRIFTVIAFG